MMNKLEKLSKREREVLSLMSNVLSDEEIMRKLCIEKSTLKTHQRTIYKKLGLNQAKQARSLNRLRAVMYYTQKLNTLATPEKYQLFLKDLVVSIIDTVKDTIDRHIIR